MILVVEKDFTKFLGQEVGLKHDVIIREWMEDVARKAEELFREHVPIHSGRMFSHIHRGDVERHPHVFRVEVGITEIEDVSDKEAPYYPLFVHEGTGIYGPRKNLIDAPIGNVFAFEKEGEGTVFTRTIKGQEPQSFLDDIEDQLSSYIRVKKRELAAIIDALE